MAQITATSPVLPPPPPRGTLPPALPTWTPGNPPATSSGAKESFRHRITSWMEKRLGRWALPVAAGAGGTVGAAAGAFTLGPVGAIAGGVGGALLGGALFMAD